MIRMDKRWAHRRERWVPPGEVFRPAAYSVDVVPEAAARAFVCDHHYSGSWPAARLSIGLFGPGPELVGVAVFSVPMNERVITRWTGFAPTDGAELGRFVCAPSVRFNGESWFLARSLPFIRSEKGARGIVSYADPLERRSAGGWLTKRAHWGTIYQASNAVFAGRSAPRTVIVGPDGRVLSGRTLSKIRKQERGWEYAARELAALGAPTRRRHEDLSAWLNRSLTDPRFRRVRHPGNLAYVFGTDQDETTLIRRLHGGGLPYEKRVAA